MSRIPLVAPRPRGLLRRLLFRETRRRYGEVPEPVRAYAHHPGLLYAWTVHEAAFDRAARRLDPQLRDLVVHRVATRIGCEWCVDFGTMLSLRAGISVQRHRALADYPHSDAFTELEKRALAYADAMTALPMTVTDAQVAWLQERLGPDGLVELTYAVALENFRARTNHALGLTSQGYTSGDACPMPFADQISAAAGGPGSASTD